LLAHRAARLVRGNAGLLPFVFFALAFLIAAIGPGAIASVALVAPVAMATGARAGVPHLLSAIMVGTGANAGNFSPISAVGAMLGGLMTKIGLAGQEWKAFAASFAAHVLVALAAYVLFGGPRLLRAGGVVAGEHDAALVVRRHWVTMIVTAVWTVVVIVWRVNIGLAAFTAGALL